MLPRSLWLFALGVTQAVKPVDQSDVHPKYARVDPGIETVWQRPHGEPKGIFFIAHGCQHQGTDIFSDVGHDGWRFQACKGSNFRRCLGLPEEVRLRQAVRARGYVAMAVSGGSGFKSCWFLEEDAWKVKRAVEHVRQAEGLPENAPVLATGASSGGALMGQLAAPLDAGGLPHLQCIVPQIMDLRNADMNRGVPTLFVHMPRDDRTAQRIASDLEILRSKKKIRAAELTVLQAPLTVELLSRCVSPEKARDIVSSLKNKALLDDTDHLTVNPRAQRWVAPVREVLVTTEDSLKPDESCLAEIMNVAWAQHEFTSQYAEQMVDFCEGHGSYAPRDVQEQQTTLSSDALGRALSISAATKMNSPGFPQGTWE